MTSITGADSSIGLASARQSFQRSPSLRSVTSSSSAPTTLASVDIEEYIEDVDWVEQIGSKISLLQIDLVPVKQELEQLKATLAENLAQQKNLKKDTSWFQRIRVKASRDEFRTQMQPLKEEEKNLKLAIKETQTIAKRMHAEINMLHSHLLKLKKPPQTSVDFKDEIKADEMLFRLEEIADRAKHRKSILKAIADFSTKFKCEREQAIAQAEADSLALAQNTKPSSINPQPSLLLRKTLQTRLLLTAYDKGLQHLDLKLASAKAQRSEVRQYCFWYRPRPYLDKMELKEIKLVIKRVKASKTTLLSAHKAVKKEQKRLEKQNDKLNSIIERLNKIQNRPLTEPRLNWFKSRLSDKLTKLETKKIALEQDQDKKLKFALFSSDCLKPQDEASVMFEESNTEIIPPDAKHFPNLIFDVNEENTEF